MCIQSFTELRSSELRLHQKSGWLPHYSVEEVVANMQHRLEIPSPVDGDEWSDDEFDGYVNSDVG